MLEMTKAVSFKFEKNCCPLYKVRSLCHKGFPLSDGVYIALIRFSFLVFARFSALLSYRCAVTFTIIIIHDYLELN